MPYYAITISEDGVDKLHRQFARSVTEIQDFTPAWPSIRTILVHSLLHRFAAEGPGWHPLAQSTRRQRKRLGYGADHPILVRTRRLLKSFTQEGAAGHLELATPLTFAVGSELHAKSSHWSLAAIHQRGAPGAHIPARPIAKLSFGEKAEIRRVVAKYVHDVITGQYPNPGAK